MVSALVFLDYEFLFNWHVQNIEQNRISKFRSFLFLSWNLEHHFRGRLGCAPAWEISVQPKSRMPKPKLGSSWVRDGFEFGLIGSYVERVSKILCHFM